MHEKPEKHTISLLKRLLPDLRKLEDVIEDPTKLKRAKDALIRFAGELRIDTKGLSDEPSIARIIERLLPELPNISSTRGSGFRNELSGAEGDAMSLANIDLTTNSLRTIAAAHDPQAFFVTAPELVNLAQPKDEEGFNPRLEVLENSTKAEVYSLLQESKLGVFLEVFQAQSLIFLINTELGTICYEISKSELPEHLLVKAFGEQGGTYGVIENSLKDESEAEVYEQICAPFYNCYSVAAANTIVGETIFSSKNDSTVRAYFDLDSMHALTSKAAELLKLLGYEVNPAEEIGFGLRAGFENRDSADEIIAGLKKMYELGHVVVAYGSQPKIIITEPIGNIPYGPLTIDDYNTAFPHGILAHAAMEPLKPNPNEFESISAFLEGCYGLIYDPKLKVFKSVA